MAQLVYTAELNSQQILQSLKNIDSNIDKLTKSASKGFDGVGKSAKASGVEIGAISGIVSSLTTAFINLGQQAVSAFGDIINESVKAAIEVDTLKSRLNGIFDGNKEAAGEAFDFIQSRSVALGIDLKELAGPFLPKSESLAQFERIAKVATALARSDPEQGALGARIALIEAQSGTFTSLQRRFEIPRADINKIKAAFEESGTEGFITELENALARGGRSFEDYADTASAAFSRVGIAGQQIEEAVGKPIVEALERLATEGLDALGELKDGVFTFDDDILVFADTVGRAIGQIIDYISSIDFSSINAEELVKVADYIFSLIGTAQLAGTQIATFIRQFSQLPGVSLLVQGLGYELAHLDDALLTLSQVMAIANASLAQFQASGEKAQVATLALGTTLNILSGDVTGAIADFNAAVDVLENSKSGQDAYRESILESQKQFEDYRKSLTDNKKAQDDLYTSLKKTAEGNTEVADSSLAAADAQREQEEAAEKLEEAQDKVAKAEAQAAEDHARKLEDIEIASERKRLDIAIEFAQKREDEARKNLQKLDDIRRKYNQDVSDAATDLDRKEEDIARKHGQESIDLEQDLRQKRLDVETEYRRKLQDIQAQFQLDADEAEEKRDAVAFVKALKQRDQKVSEAQTDRSRSIEQTRLEGEQRRTELQAQQEREIEEARIANERKLEDLRLSLQRSIEEQNIAHEREIEDIRLAEERKLEEAATARERDIEDANTAYARKLEDLQTSLADEYAIIAAANAAAEAEQARHVEAMNAINASYTPANAGFGANPGTIATSSGSPASGTATPGTRGGQAPKRGLGTGGVNVGSGSGGRQPRSPGRRRAAGGAIQAGQPYVVGEDGPEVIVPETGGNVMPNPFGFSDAIEVGKPSGFGKEVSGSGKPTTPEEEARGRTRVSSPIAPSSGIMMNTGGVAGGVTSVDNSRVQYINVPLSNDQILNPIQIAQVRNVLLMEMQKLG